MNVASVFFRFALSSRAIISKRSSFGSQGVESGYPDILAGSAG
jgi:hypothetical protein